MNAPLALFLTHFSAPPPPVEFLDVIEDLPEPEAEPSVTLTVAELDAQIEAAVQEARSEAEQRHEAEMAALVAAHEVAAAESLAAARAEWAESTGESLAANLDRALADLRIAIADRMADVVRPLVADAAFERTKAELIDVLDRLLADPTQPHLCLRGPEDLAAALRTARPSADIEWIVAETVEVVITADATRIETKLATAMADIAATEI